MSDDEMPQPDAFWIALGMLAWAIAVALGPTVRGRFIDALVKVSGQHEGRTKIVAFPTPTLKTGDMPRATRIAATWVRRLADEFRAARGG